MKHPRMFLLAFLITLVATVGASGSASATVLCNTQTNPCTEKYALGTVVKSELEGSSVFETTSGTVVDTCNASTTSGKVENAGSSSSTVTMSAGMTFSICSVVTVTVKAGSVEFHRISGTWNATLTGKGAEITVEIFGLSCDYGTSTSGTHLGVLTGGFPFRLHINAILPRISGSGLCPTELRWTATYKGTAPNPLYIADS